MGTYFDQTALTRERERCGYSKSHFARALGVSPSYVTDLEAGRRSPSTPMLCRLGEVLDVAPEDLLLAGHPALETTLPRLPARFDPLVGTPVEAAMRLGVSVSTVHLMIREGRIPFCHLGRRKVGIPWAALDEWLRAEAESSLSPYCPRCACSKCMGSRRKEWVS